MTVDALVTQIITHPLFFKQKDIVEHFDGWHDHERIFDHSLKTAERAKQAIHGDFITNKKAHDLFLQWMDEDVFGMKRSDVSVLIALLHDCGKILQYKEGKNIKPLLTKFPNTDDQTSFPGHEYWGGEIAVPEILKDRDISDALKEHIARLVKLHGTFNNNIYFQSKQEWSLEKLIEDAKSRAQGYYKETMFNAYCDCYAASAFVYAKGKIEEIYNEPLFYVARKYVIDSTI